jgi:hypothetical protein
VSNERLMGGRTARAARASPEVISGILNCVCPDCGGSTGGAGRAFECQGECQRDWREMWEQHLARFLRGRKRMSLVHGGSMRKKLLVD